MADGKETEKQQRPIRVAPTDWKECEEDKEFDEDIKAAMIYSDPERKKQGLQEIFARGKQKTHVECSQSSQDGNNPDRTGQR